MGHGIKCQLIDKVKPGKYTLQLGEFMDVSGLAQVDCVCELYSQMGSLNKNYSRSWRYLEHVQGKTYSQQWGRDYRIMDYQGSDILAFVLMRLREWQET